MLKGSSVLLSPADALPFVADIGAIGVVNLMPEVWYRVEGGEEHWLIEDPAIPDFTELARQRNAARAEVGPVGSLAEATAAVARDYLRHDLPPRTVYVSFVLDQPPDDEFWRYIVEHPLDE